MITFRFFQHYGQRLAHMVCGGQKCSNLSVKFYVSKDKKTLGLALIPP